MTAPDEDAPKVGDLVEITVKGRPAWRVVTDIKAGCWVLRSVPGGKQEPPLADPAAMALVARRGHWQE